jgi:copper transport protein
MLRRVLIKGLTATVIAAGVVIGAAGPAGAHATILGTEPRYNASLATPPERVLIRYDLPVELRGAQISLTRSGRAVAVGRPQFASPDHKDVSLPLPKLSPGPHVLTWFLFGSDGDVMGGELTFTVLSASDAAMAPIVGPILNQPPPAQFTGVSFAPLSRAQDVARLAASASLVVFVGSLTFVAGLWWAGALVPRFRLIVWAALVVTLLSNAGALGLKGAAVQGRSALAVFSPSSLTALSGTHVGKVLAVRLGLLLLAIPVVALMTMAPERVLGSDLWAIGAAASGLGGLATHAWLSHAWTKGLVPAAVHVVHLAAISVWLGGLVVLAAVVLPRRQLEELRDLVPRFSRLAFRSVVTAVVAGTALLLLISPRWSALPTTEYGRFLITKLLLVAALLAAAFRARTFVHDHFLAGALAAGQSDRHAAPIGVSAGVQATTIVATQAPPAPVAPMLRPFVNAVVAELCIAASILTATAFLVGRAPPS